MPKRLIIVESPSKARTIKKYIGKDYTITASIGHIKDLPEKEIGVDIRHDFKPRYQIIRGKSKIIQKMKEEARKADEIYIATDPDREGEAIAWHISTELKKYNPRIKRVLFFEMTRSGIQSGMSDQRDVNMFLVNAQQARRIMDRLVGYQVSPILWKTIYSGLSAGRVQSVALRLVCEREEEISSFIPREYWTIHGIFKIDEGNEFEADLVKVEGEKPEISTEKDANSLIEKLQVASYVVKSAKKRTVQKKPYPPFTTSTLQQEAARHLGFSARKTMMIAQQLYEGLDIGSEGTTGLITYMRTDSTRLSPEAVGRSRSFIKKAYGSDYVPTRVPDYYRKKSNIQDAHEAVRPTLIEKHPEELKKHLNPDQYRLYRLIWHRFIASMMETARYRQYSLEIMGNSKYLFRTTRSVLTFDGFLKVYREYMEKEKEEKKALPGDLKQGDGLSLTDLIKKQHFTEPPPRYSESTLIKELDKLGIGRPSTYAAILSTLFQRKYVFQQSPAGHRNKKSLIPTPLGKTVNQLLTGQFPDIFEVKFTARMENELDKVESGDLTMLKVLNDFYSPFRTRLEEVKQKTAELKQSIQEKTDRSCPRDGGELIIKWGKNGRFLACSNFPECRYTETIELVAETPQKREKPCPQCGAEVILRNGRYGKFWACSKYPTCDYTEPYTTGVACPEEGCSGHLVQKKTKKGKIFYACNSYPKCKFALWNYPVDQVCPNCHFGVMEKKSTKKRGEHLSCPKCKHTLVNSNSLRESE
jgi:DNA topoisomerase-1